jgi:hypothetical protein
LKSLRSREDKLKIRGDPAPPAYVVITNNPDYYSPDSPVRRWAFVEGFKMLDFRMEAAYPTLREARKARERHIEISDLIESLRQHTWVPMTFDADIPELAFGEAHPRLQIGDRYTIPGRDGTHVVATLVAAHVFKQRKKAVGIYVTESGENLLAECPMTDDELAGYERHPDTFFGKFDPSVRPINEPLKLYDWFHDRYCNLPKPELLELMKDAPDIDQLQQLSQREIAEEYCERLVYSIVNTATESRQQGEHSV